MDLNSRIMLYKPCLFSFSSTCKLAFELSVAANALNIVASVTVPF